MSTPQVCLPPTHHKLTARLLFCYPGHLHSPAGQNRAMLFATLPE